MKKFELLGKSLSKDQLKLIKGGDEEVPGAGCPLKCSSIECGGSCKCFHSGTANEYCGSR